MEVVERDILERLINEAKEHGFKVTRFACTPATGEEGDEINGASLTLQQCADHAEAWDSDSIIEFDNRNDEHFWVLLVWGNDENVISDYKSTPEADTIVNAVYDWIER